ncbi:OmpH family outer membrane protein [Carboxylicivirga linearis]|uniref:OmpH family outer membrane protein n=1 Tax=Carboxylicivirga linearis TaxID=1628157 RepID=A0ABS5JQM5_9BACT|nr:OmpH family outer membrane protein [Carboxylicivirga linearis]MBS2097140.1 OmpH family outer membrane protein [Carboxylicivirga linearis]
MNKVVGILTLVFLSAFTVQAQQPMKFGHLNSNELMAAMPELQAMQTQMESEFKVKEDQLAVMQEELQGKQQEYQQNASALTPPERQQKEQELAEMSQKVQNYYMLAQQQMQAKQQEMTAPIVQKLKAAIEEVGDEEGFLYIFDLSSKVPVFNSEKSIDVTALVKAKLGIQ